MKYVAIFFGVMFAVIFSVLMALVFTGVAVGAANAWILQGTFGEGWSAVWDRWLIAIGWAFLFGGATGSSVSVRSR